MRRFPIFALLATILMFACQQGEKKRLADSKGLPSELLLVVDDPVWQSDLSDTLKNITQCPVPCIMQYEPFFRVTRISSKYYSQRYRTFHSKLFVHLDSEEQKASLAVAHDVSAKPQTEVTITAPDLAALRNFLSKEGIYIRDLINEAQIQMRADALAKQHSKKIDDEVRKHLGLSIFVPNSIIASKRGKQFYWAGSNQNEKDINIVIYKFPWNADKAFTDEDFISKRDSVMKVNIPGSRPDQWMQTTFLDGKPIIESRTQNIKGKNVYEAVGMWEMRNGALGGPFISITHIDTASATATVSEGFVYSPSTEKRELLRQLEATLYTSRKL